MAKVLSTPQASEAYGVRNFTIARVGNRWFSRAQNSTRHQVPGASYKSHGARWLEIYDVSVSPLPHGRFGIEYWPCPKDCRDFSTESETEFLSAISPDGLRPVAGVAAQKS